MPKLLHIAVACAENRVIGRDGRLPWRIPEDAAHFEALTAGNICLMGRVCFDTWPAATREGRQPIVLTSRPLQVPSPRAPIDQPRAEARQSGQTVPIAARSLGEALAMADTMPGDVVVCGGQRIFEETLALKRPMRLHLTLVHAEVPGDRFFPEWRNLEWREIERRPSRDVHFFYTFYTLERVIR
ncbi:MAG TPA: dihydrofolate reductase [Opitutaceae bacterium]|nr:dihydrofolate reductase [Opitutaceae bacterium]